MASRVAKMALALAVFAAVGMVFFAPLNSAVQDNTGTQTVTNETFAVAFNDSYDLQGYDVDDSETVWAYNQTSGSFEQATEGTDYEFDYDAGEITPLNTSLVDSGEDMKVTYDYQASGTLATTVILFIPVMFGVLIFTKIAMQTQEFL